MKKKLLIPVIISLIATGCGAPSAGSTGSANSISSSYNSAEASDSSAISEVSAVSESSSKDQSTDLIDTNDIQILTYQAPGGKVYAEEAVLAIDSTEFSDELIYEYYDILQPYLDRALSEEGYMAYGAIIFRDLIPESYGDFIGCYISFNGSAESFIYLETKPNGFYEPAEGDYCIEGYSMYLLRDGNHEIAYRFDEFTEEELEEYYRPLD